MLREPGYAKEAEMAYLKYVGCINHQEDLLRIFIQEQSEAHAHSIQTLNFVARCVAFDSFVPFAL